MFDFRVIRRRSQPVLWGMGLGLLLLLAFILVLMTPSHASAASLQDCDPGDYDIRPGSYPYDQYSRGTGFVGKARHPYVHYKEPQVYSTSAKVESVLVYDPSNGDQVEVGWHKSKMYILGEVREIGPLMLIARVYNGQYAVWPWAPELQAEAWYHFRVKNDGTYWRWYIGDTQYWAQYYPDLSYGLSVGMGERHNLCTSGFARLTSLEKYKNGNWSSWTGQIAPMQPPCYGSVYCDEDPAYKYCFISNTEFKVRADGVNCFDP